MAVIVQSDLWLGGICGAWVSAVNRIIKPFAIGNLKTIAVPVGATKLWIGFNDDKFADNAQLAAYNIKIENLTKGTSENVAPNVKTMPWPGNDATYPYGINDGLAPLQSGLIFSDFDVARITYIAGGMNVGGFATVDGRGVNNLPTVNNNGSTGTKFPTLYMTHLEGIAILPYEQVLVTETEFPFEREE